jgi:protoporphyrinogen/coproporphyrinogen III oxidase
MKRIAIIGGGIAGLAAAYELEKQRKAGADIDWTLYEASNRLGGIIETTRRDGFVLEGGPDGWVSEKPWARELAIELGLESQLIYSNDATRKTYILIDNKLRPLPDRMRMMVPEDLATIEGSTLFSATAREAYAAELANAAQLREAAPNADESVASFIRRHFGDEVLTKIGAPLLSGVFGGDVEKLSAQAVMPAFVAMEREQGSLIAAVQAKIKSRGDKPQQPIFTSLRDGVGSLVEALVAQLPSECLHLNRSALSLKRERGLWCLRTSKGNAGKSKKHFHHVFIATPADVTLTLIEPLDPQTSTLIPQQSSSAVLAAFAWSPEVAATFAIPPGFGFLVPHPPSAHPPELVISTERICTPLAIPTERACTPIVIPTERVCTPLVISTEAQRSGEIAAFTSAEVTPEPQLLACTFVDQKFPDRAPAGARVIRVFFAGNSHENFAAKSDEEVAAIALTQLQKILGPLPTPEVALTTVRRWPRSLPQYEVGHLERIAELETRIATLGGLTLLGNSYRGVGLPDLIREARAAARTIVENTTL